MREGVLINAPPTSLNRLVPEIRNRHTGKYDTQNSCDEPKDHEDAGEDGEFGDHTGGEDSVVKDEDAQLGEGDGASEQDLLGPNALISIVSVPVLDLP